MSIKPQELVGRAVIWTKIEPGKQTKRIITKIAMVHHLSISLVDYPGIYFYLNGNQRKTDKSSISKIQLIDEQYASQLEKQWQEDAEKRELINFLIENKKHLISLSLDELKIISNSLAGKIQYQKLT